jgi:hypothetical protein
MIIANRSPEVLRSLDQAATDLAAPLKHRVSLETKLRQNLLHLLEGWPVDFKRTTNPFSGTPASLSTPRISVSTPSITWT